MTDKERILQLIENGQLKQALQQTLTMLKYLSQKDIYATTTQILAQLNTADNHLKTGQILQEEHSVVVNRLRLAFLDVFETYEAPPATRRKGYLAHNVPSEMTLNNRVECCIKISDVEEALTRKAGFRLEDTDFHLRQITRVNLEGNSDAFYIEQITKLTDQTILPEEIGSWKFFVTPLKEGTHDLIIRVQGLVPSLLGNEAQIEEDCPINVCITTHAVAYKEMQFKQLPVQVGEASIPYSDTYSEAAPKSVSPRSTFQKKTTVAWAALLCAFIGGATGFQLFFNEAEIAFYNNCNVAVSQNPRIFVNDVPIADKAIQYNKETKMVIVKFKPRYDLWLYGDNYVTVKNLFGKDTVFKVQCSGKDLFWFNVPTMDICETKTVTPPIVPSKYIKLNCILPIKALLVTPSVIVDGKPFFANFIKPQVWQVVLPDTFFNKRVIVSMMDSAYQCTGQVIKLDSVVETLQMKCSIKPPPPVAKKASVILKTQAILLNPLAIVYLENDKVLDTIKFSPTLKGQSTFEISNLDLGRKYRFDIQGFMSNQPYKCRLPSAVLVNKDKQTIELDCIPIPFVTTGGKREITLVLQNYQNLRPLIEGNVTFNKIQSDINLAEKRILSTDTLKTVVETGKSYQFVVNSLCVECLASATVIKPETREVNLLCKKMVNAKGCATIVKTLTSVVVQTSVNFDKANLYLDGSPFGTIQNKGKTFQGGGYLEEGTHTLVMKKGKLSCEKTVVIAKGENVYTMDCLCDVSLSKKAGFKSPKLYINGKKTTVFAKSADNKKLSFTMPRQTNKALFRIEEDNETCETQGIPLSNQLKLSFTKCSTTFIPSKPYAITFKVDKQLNDDILKTLILDWKKNKKEAKLKKNKDYTINTVDNSIKVTIWDWVKNPINEHTITLILPYKDKPLQIGQFSGTIRDSVIKCPICLSCME